MISEGTRRFDLYDFFSVLLPGGIFTIGLVPFLPTDAEVFSVGGVAAGVILGFVFGRALHAIGLRWEASPDDKEWKFLQIGGFGLGDQKISTNHREQFIHELLWAENISKGLVNEFYRKSVRTFSDLDLPESRARLLAQRRRSTLRRDACDSELETLYVLVRAKIHMDSRGRSRTFQAVLDFQRTMLPTSVLLFVIYGLYVVSITSEAGNIVGYEPYISSLDIAWWLIFLTPLISVLVVLYTFVRSRTAYRRYFVQYLMADFITLYIAEHGSDAGD